MLKKIFRLLSRETAQSIIPVQETPIRGSGTSVDEEISEHHRRVRDAVSLLKTPATANSEREISKLAVETLGENAFLLLPDITKALGLSEWSVIWRDGKVSFFYEASPWDKILKLSEYVRTAAEEAAADRSDQSFGSIYLSAVCSEMLSLHRQGTELRGGVDGFDRPTMLSGLKELLGPNWDIQTAPDGHDFVICRPSISAKERDAEPSSTKASRPSAFTIH